MLLRVGLIALKIAASPILIISVNGIASAGITILTAALQELVTRASIFVLAIRGEAIVTPAGACQEVAIIHACHSMTAPQVSAEPNARNCALRMGTRQLISGVVANVIQADYASLAALSVLWAPDSLSTKRG